MLSATQSCAERFGRPPEALVRLIAALQQALKSEAKLLYAVNRSLAAEIARNMNLWLLPRRPITAGVAAAAVAGLRRWLDTSALNPSHTTWCKVLDTTQNLFHRARLQ